MPTATRLPLLLGLIVLAALSRLLPHPPNVSPVAAVALFGAAALPQRWLAVLAPVVAFYLSDLVLNNTLYASYFDGFYWGVSYWQIGAVALMAVLGLGVLRNRQLTVPRLGGAAVGATAVFFLVSNFGVWAGGAGYPPTAAGLLACYAAGLPFLLNSLLGNLFFVAVLFGLAHQLNLLQTTATKTA